MKLKQIFALSTIAASLALAGCGGDVNITPTTVDNSQDNRVDNSVQNPAPTPEPGTPEPTEPEATCATYSVGDDTFEGVLDGANCLYNQTFSSSSKEITESFTIPALSNGGIHIFQGALFIGDDVETSDTVSVPANGPTLTVEAGVTVAFSNPEDYLRVARGAKIEAEGTSDKPITFTSIQDVDGDNATVPEAKQWGGIVVAGRSITNKCSAEQLTGDICNHKTEGTIAYAGGPISDDNSGTLKHIAIKYAGNGAEGDELNGLSLYAVGSATTVEFVHVHRGFDDGVEVFGGTVDLKGIVVTDTGDDGLDWDNGWTGRAQHVLVRSLESGNHGFEADGTGEKDPASVVDVSNPTISNVTIIGNGNKAGKGTAAGIEFKEFLKASIYNTVVVNTADADDLTDADTSGFGCLDLYNEKDLSADNGVHANATNGDIKFQSTYFACKLNFEAVNTALTGTLASFDYDAWFTGNTDTKIIGLAAENPLDNVLDGVKTKTAMLDSTGTAVEVTVFDASTLNTSDTFFEATTYVGALGEDTTGEWADFVASSLARAQ